ncbi:MULTISPECIES: hypothetical protein [unclassified Archaeoglobus]|uniref:hypothetical protein n=1 Tax=unclassified Archaeoglobus TaxID=2643606 RepID=UPI0025C2A96F|nr:MULTISPECIES: hypothetical protein [unclassified Archaeoglobus]
MREELGLYVIAKELCVDIEEVKSWSVDKIIRWSIALKLMGQEAKKQVEQPQRKEHLIVFR